jgi:hypothetical protein
MMPSSGHAAAGPVLQEHPSRAAVKSALDWYEALGAHGPVAGFQRALTTRLRAALANPDRAPATDCDALVQFGVLMQALTPIHPDAPRCNVGDVVTALTPVAAVSPAAAAWEWEPSVDAEVLAKLEVRETSAGIVKNQRHSREGWWAHAAHSRAFIREAVPTCAARRIAVVLGAGQRFDLPLLELARAFDRLILVDIDAAALEATAAAVFSDPALRARVELRVSDVTGINKQLIGRVDRIAAEARTADEAREQLGACVRSYHLGTGAVLLAPGERADLMVSACMLSQIAWSQGRYALVVYERRFGRLPEEAGLSWLLPWQEFELRVQQDHINALPAFADVAVLMSDVAVRSTELDAAGIKRVIGPRRYLLSVPKLCERIPCFMRIDRHGAWQWDLLRPEGPGHPGHLYDVEGLVLRLQ